MASGIFLSSIEDINRGNIDPDTDTFKFLLVDASYTPNLTTHMKRSDITGEVVGTGYTAGGTTVTCTVSKNTGASQVDLTFSNPTWPNSTISARRGIIYKSRGGAASADELVTAVDFNGVISSTAAAFTVTLTSPLRYQL